MDDSEKQRILDEEHLRLLRIGYLVMGGANLFFALFPLIYVAMGIFIAAIGAGGSDRSGEPEAAAIGLLFVVLGLAASALIGASAALKLLAARALGKKRSRTLCYVAAAVACLSMPYGTLLGIFTFIVLSRPSVKALFEREPDLLAPPPHRSFSSLFADEEAMR